MATSPVSGGGGSPRPEQVHIHTLSCGLCSGLWADAENLQYERASLNVTNLDTLAHTYTLSLLDSLGEVLPSVAPLSPAFLLDAAPGSAFWLTQTQAQATILPGQTASLLYYMNAIEDGGLRAVVTEITPVGAPLSPCLPTFEVTHDSQSWVDDPNRRTSRVVLEHFREIVTVGYIFVSPTGTPTPASTQTRISREQYNAYVKRGRTVATSKQRSAPGRSGRRPK